MIETVTAAEANQHFSRVLRRVREGSSFVITSHGKPVAKLVPMQSEDDEAEAARTRVIARLRELPLAHLGTFSRDQGYDEAE
jgi:prevent-host-death family protein